MEISIITKNYLSRWMTDSGKPAILIFESVDEILGYAGPFKWNLLSSTFW